MYNKLYSNDSLERRAVSKTIFTQLLMRIRTTTITNRVTNTPATFQSFSYSVPDYFKVVQINVHTYSL